MHVAWGLAWFVGNGLFFLSNGPGGRVFVKIPSWLPLTVLLALLVLAGVSTVFAGVKTFGHGATDPTYEQGLIWVVATTGLASALHLAGSAIWLDRSQLRLESGSR